MPKDYEQLKRRVEALEKWKEERERQVIPGPYVDNQSIQILGKYFLTQLDSLLFEAGVSGTPFRTILVQQGRGTSVSEVFTSTTLIPFTASASANTLTLGNDLTNLKQGAFEDGSSVVVRSTGALPTPLDSITTYTVANGTAGGTVIQLDNGGIVNITDAGTGQHFIYAG